MPRLLNAVPRYRRHRPSSQAVVTLNGKDHYLGPYGSPTSREVYNRLIQEWLASGRMSPGPGPAENDRDINQLLVAYWEFAQGYYVKNGRPTGEIRNLKEAFRPLAELYGSLPIYEFSPIRLKAVREIMIKKGLCRRVINSRINRIRRIFKWAVENEFVEPSVLHGLQAVAPLKKGRSEARESAGVKPVPDAYVDAVLPIVPRPVKAMIELQRITGMRPGEVTIMRGSDLDTTGRIWVYRPVRHKTEHHGAERIVYLGPKAQAILQPFLRADLAAYLFSPKESLEQIHADRRRNRKTPMTPSQRKRNRKRHPKWIPHEKYTCNTYHLAIYRACVKAGIPRWFPNQLRHNAATRLRKEYGIEAARVILGHRSARVTEIYAETDHLKAADIMAKVG